MVASRELSFPTNHSNRDPVPSDWLNKEIRVTSLGRGRCFAVEYLHYLRLSSSTNMLCLPTTRDKKINNDAQFIVPLSGELEVGDGRQSTLICHPAASTFRLASLPITIERHLQDVWIIFDKLFEHLIVSIFP